MKQLLLLTLVTISLYSCNTNNGNNVTPSALYSGSMVYTRTTGTYMGTAFDDGTSMAEFFSSPMSLSQSPFGHLVFVDSVIINGLNMADNGDTQYVDGPPASYIVSGNQITWKVAGAHGIPSFTYNHTGGFPDFSASVPTTLTRANGLTVSFASGSYSGADSGYVIINEYAPAPLIKTVALPGTISFSSQELSSVPTGAGTISYGVAGVSTQTFGGKNFYFAKDRRKTELVTVN